MLKQKIKELSHKYFNQIKDLRRYFHQYPELSFQEKKTSEKIQSELLARRIFYQKDFGGQYGVVADLKPGDKNTVALRADMDALPITETNNLSYKSKNDGVMHACGHDFHMAALLGTCFILNDLRNDIDGNVRFIFQPGEEVLPGGAMNMIDHGVLSNPKVIKAFGQHIMPDIPSGTFGFVSGPTMASTDEVYIEVKGKGGHAAEPHRLVDPIMISSILLNLIQSLMASGRPTQIPMVLSIGRIIAEGATNIIPDKVELSGTFRCMDESWRKKIKKKVKDIIQRVAKSYGAQININMLEGYPCLVNNRNVTEASIVYAQEFLGKSRVERVEPKLYGEDFAYFSHKVPSCFFFTGVGNANIESGGLHTSYLRIDENSLVDSMGLLSWLAIKNL